MFTELESFKHLYYSAVKNPFARQFKMGYYPVHREVTIRDIQQHLAGEVTLGAYLVNKTGQCCFFCIDLDLKKGLVFNGDNFEVFKEQATLYIEQFHAFEIEVYCNLSGNRGIHIVGFTSELILASVLKPVVENIVNKTQLVDPNLIGTPEIFPKQTTTDNVGSLIKIPLGIHLKSGNRALFVDPDNGFKLIEDGDIYKQLNWLTKNTKKNSLELMQDIYNTLCKEKSVFKKSNKQYDNTLVNLIKSRVNILDVVKSYGIKIDTGGVGLCPFHDDKCHSFSVNEKGQYFNCFSSNCKAGGGDSIKFIMLIENIGFWQAIEKLAQKVNINIKAFTKTT